MQAEIHPEYNEIKVTCSCGHSFTTHSTLSKDIHIDICSKCHPFFTGTQKIVDTAGRVERFRSRYKKFDKQKKTDTQATDKDKA